MVRVFVCLISAVLLSSSAFAESQAHGQIMAASGTRMDKLFVEAEPVDGAGLIQKVPVSTAGYFYFEAISGQTYVLRVTDVTGNAIVPEVVKPDPLGSVRISLPQRAATHPIDGTVSFYEMQHRVPAKALKEGREADKYSAKHDMKSYIDHAEKAIAIDPGWTVARRNLGIAYMISGDDEKALRQFRKCCSATPIL
jgi:hypothetical protein